MAEDYDLPSDDFLLLGKVTKAHGLLGEVKVFLYSGQPENLTAYRELTLVDKSGKISESLVITKSRAQGKTAIVSFASVRGRMDAEKIENMGVLLAKAHLPMVDKDEYYWHQYQGKTVVDLDGKVIGQVSRLFSNGMQDILVVIAGTEEILIPIIKGIVVDDSGQELVINPPPGLIELNTHNG